MRIPYWPILAVPSLSIMLGFFLNAIVMAANGGQMPVLVPGGNCSLIDSQDILHVCMNAHTHLKILADWISFYDSMTSLGDFFLLFGKHFYIPALYTWAVLVIRDYRENW